MPKIIVGQCSTLVLVVVVVVVSGGGIIQLKQFLGNFLNCAPSLVLA